MDDTEERISRWLEESDDEQDVAGSGSESEDDEFIPFQSDHDTESEIEEHLDDNDSITDSDHEDRESEENTNSRFYLSRHTGRNGPTQKWSMTPPSKSVRTRAHNIILHLPGVKQSARWAKSPTECFSLFFTNEVLDFIVKHTNSYIAQVRSNFQRERDAKDTNTDEMKAFLGLLIISGVLRASHLNFIDLWSTDGTGVDIFRLTMKYQRFLFILRCLRFDDKHTRAERTITDNLAPIRELCDILQAKFQEAYTPGENVTIDEQLTSFRGRFKGKVYMPSKPNKYGITIQAIVDSKTFYLFGFEIYAGKQPQGPFSISNSAIDIVKRLVEPIKGTGRNVTTDNWYTSVKLAIELLDPSYKLTIVGTVNKNKPEIPKLFLPNKDRTINSSMFGLQNHMTMVSYVPKPKKSSSITIYYASWSRHRLIVRR